jgi:hypothetical protein
MDTKEREKPITDAVAKSEADPGGRVLRPVGDRLPFPRPTRLFCAPSDKPVFRVHALPEEPGIIHRFLHGEPGDL